MHNQKPGECLSRRSFLRTAATGAAAVSALPFVSSFAATRATKKPNVLMILGDDLGYEVPAYSGGQTMPTPVLDNLAKESLQFTQCYCTPLCSPSRVQLLSGKYAFNNGWPHGIWDRAADKRFLDPSMPTIGHMFRDAGYKTGMAGKWQLCHYSERPTHPKDCGFDEHCMWTYGHADSRLPSRYWEPWIEVNGTFQEDKKDPTVFGPDVYTDFLVDFMTRNKDVPFFAYYPMCLPHIPFVKTPLSEGSQLSNMEKFTDMVEYIDLLVGKLLKALDDLGIRDNTIVIFTADNGSDQLVTSQWNGMEVPGEKKKLTYFGTHVPCLVQWKGVTEAGGVCNDLIDFSDIMPTLAELCGVDLPANNPIDGVSMANQVRGKAGNKRNWIYAQFYAHKLAIDGKYAARMANPSNLYSSGSTVELFDLNADPFMQSPIAEGAGSAEAEAARAMLGAVVKDPKNAPDKLATSVSTRRHTRASQKNFELHAGIHNGRLRIQTAPFALVEGFDSRGRRMFRHKANAFGRLNIGDLKRGRALLIRAKSRERKTERAISRQ